MQQIRDRTVHRHVGESASVWEYWLRVPHFEHSDDWSIIPTEQNRPDHWDSKWSISVPMNTNNANFTLNEALMTRDEHIIRTCYQKLLNGVLPQDKNDFWVQIHQTITGRRSLPFSFRIESKKWLNQRNLNAIDDGELGPFGKIPVDVNDVPF